MDINNNDSITPEAVSKADVAPGQELRKYTRPRLQCLGDLRSTTLGGSPGVGDSGGLSNFKPFSFS